MRLDGLPKLEDLRKMSEEQFVEAFEMLRSRTKDWTEFPPELFRETPQFLFVMRIGLGLSQQRFADELGVQKQWVRHFESGRQGFKESEVIPKLTDFLAKRFSEDVDIRKSVETFRVSQLGRERGGMKPPTSVFKLKRVFEMDPKEFTSAFLLLKEKTKDFTIFDKEILVDTPQFISIFRIILGMGIIGFSKVLGDDDAHIRRWESTRDWITPTSAQFLMLKIQKLFEDGKLIGCVDFDKVTECFKKFCMFGQTELKIKELLERASLSFDAHKELICGKKKIITDFIIRGKIHDLVLEVTTFSKVRRKDITTRIVVLDHRFQILKLFHPSFKSAVFLECDSSQIDMVKRIIEREVISTDFIVIKSFDKLIECIKQSIF